MSLIGHCAVCGADVDFTWSEVPAGPIYCAAHLPAAPAAPEPKIDVAPALDDDGNFLVEVDGEFD